MANKNLFLIDAYALIYRSYYAFIKSPRVTSKGLNTSAIYGFVNTLEELLRNKDLTHIGVVFDAPGKTFRHIEYPEYKAQREKTPEDISKSVPIIKEIIDAYNIPRLQLDGYEADDVIGTISKKAEQEGFNVYLVSPDKDFVQLVTPHVFLYKPRTRETGFDVIDYERAEDRYGLSKPTQMIDYLALVGDASDNIPGCAGVGPKTAEKLIGEYQNVNGILAHVDQLRPSVREKIEKNKDNILLSYKLATIHTDAPIDFEAHSFLIHTPNEQELKKLFDDLEFRSLTKRVIKDESPSTPLLDLFTQEEAPSKKIIHPDDHSHMDNLNYASAKTVQHSYNLIQEPSESENLANNLMKDFAVSVDTETDSLKPLSANLVGASFSEKEHEATYLAVSRDSQTAKEQLEPLQKFFENDKIEKIGQNIKYDLLVLRRAGIELKGPLFDTMIAHYLLNPESGHNMDFLAETYLRYKTIHIEELIGPKGKSQKSMRDVDPQIVAEYAGEDADITLQLKNVLEAHIKNNNMEKLLYNIELPLIRVLADMEWNGFRLDLNALAELSKSLNKRLSAIEQQIYEMAGEPFNVNSAKQVGEVLFAKLKIIDNPKKTKSGQYKTSEEELESLKKKHPIVDLILQQRGLKKLLGTYVDSFPKLVNKETGKVHTSFNQTVTSTGRLSSSNPNLQNIPIRDEEGRAMRSVFIPDDGCVIMSSDYSQIELRIMAHLSKDKNMIQAFMNNEDIHAATAAKIYHIDIADVTEDMRRKAKTANFGIIYGITAFGLSERLGIPRAEAKDLIEKYYQTYPDVKTYIANVINFAREHGYVETIMGRKRFLPDINSKNSVVRGYAERNAVNAPIQGSAADIIKIAMIRVHDEIKKQKLTSRMLLQVHDELVFNVPNNEIDVMNKLVVDKMETAVDLIVPLKTDCRWGKNWLEAHP